MFNSMLVNVLHCGIQQACGLIAHTLTIHTRDVLLLTVRQGSGVRYCASVQQRCRTGICGASVLHVTHGFFSILMLCFCGGSLSGSFEIMQFCHELHTLDTCYTLQHTARRGPPPPKKNWKQLCGSNYPAATLSAGHLGYMGVSMDAPY